MLLHLARLTMRSSLGLRGAAVLMILEDVVTVGFGVAAPLALKAVVDQVQIRSASPSLIEGEVAFLVIATLAPNVLAGLKQAHITCIVERLAANLTLRATDAAFKGIEGPGQTDLAAALARLPYSLHLIVDGLASRLAPTTLQLVASLMVLATVAPRLEAMLLSLTLLIYALAVDAGHRATRRAATEAHLRANRLSLQLGDVLSHRLRVLANDTLAQERGGLEERTDARAAAFQRLAAGGAHGAMIQTMVLLIGSLGVLAISVARVLSGHIGVGTFVLMQSYVFRLALPIGGLAAILRQSDLAFENLSEVIIPDVDPPVGRKVAQTPAALDLDAGIRCHKVCFGYGDQALLRDISFQLPPGSFTAIVGANGSGKSTLARMMAGLLTPATGSVEIFGADAADLSAEDRRRRLLYVPQLVGLFNRTIGENGLYPPSRLLASQLKERLQQWRFDPAGASIDLDAPVGPNGMRLSGGQIQKLELARLSEVATPALILDETTSALDPQAQAVAISVLRSMASERVLILVTHARHLAEQADRVLFMEGGSLAGFNSHRRLMRTHPAYRAFWRNDAQNLAIAPILSGGTTLSQTGIFDA